MAAAPALAGAAFWTCSFGRVYDKESSPPWDPALKSAESFDLAKELSAVQMAFKTWRTHTTKGMFQANKRAKPRSIPAQCPIKIAIKARI